MVMHPRPQFGIVGALGGYEAVTVHLPVPHELAVRLPPDRLLKVPSEADGVEQVDALGGDVCLAVLAEEGVVTALLLDLYGTHGTRKIDKGDGGAKTKVSI